MSAVNRTASQSPERCVPNVRRVSELEFGRSICGDLAGAERREWLVTNGLGGFASGTVAGSLTRRYHGLLFAATKPPVGRTLFVTKIEETIAYDGATYELATDRWRSGAVAPIGFTRIVSFALRGTVPVWRYGVADAMLEKTIWMEHGANVTYVRYTYVRGSGPLELASRVLVNYRDMHALTRAGDWRMCVSEQSRGVRVEAFDGAIPFYVGSDRARITRAHDWYRDFALTAESERGLDAVEDHLCAADAFVRLDVGESVTFVAGDRDLETIDGAAALARVRERESDLLETWRRSQADAAIAPAWIRRCVLAADAFVVARPLPGDPAARSIVAGYPWFGDWGRDAMIALPGLTLATGRPDVTGRILRTFAAFVNEGMLPNYFPEANEAPHYNSADAALWFVEAVGAYVETTADAALLRDLFPALEAIVAAYRDGTRYGIGLDPSDGLLRAGEAGVQVTWMDAKVGNRVVTPRIGKPVEISALWYCALRRMASLAPLAGRAAEPYASLGARAAAGFQRFWNARTACCYDVLDGPDGDDASLRPNQLFAVSLRFSPLDATRRRAIVDVCARRLFAETGLRSLDPADPRYRGRYGGGPAERDAAYHQGTSWLWLLGVFATAHARAYGDPGGARRYLDAFADALEGGGLGTLGELAQGDAPFAPCGAIAQAWSVGEALRAWHDAPRDAKICDLPFPDV